MSEQEPASLPPEKIPGSGGGGGPFIAVAGVFAVVLAGLVYMKFSGGESDAPAAAPTPSAKPTTSAPAKPALTDSLPPPPKEDDPPAPSESAGPAKKAPVGGGPCSGTCSGTPSGATRGDLQARAGSSRGCYERALRNSPTLQGKMTINVRVDPSGTVCSASVSGDSVGSGEVSNCVLNMFRNQRVAAPTGGCADVSIPLNFQPKK